MENELLHVTTLSNIFLFFTKVSNITEKCISTYSNDVDSA